jgi:voltage-gated potassium channel
MTVTYLGLTVPLQLSLRVPYTTGRFIVETLAILIFIADFFFNIFNPLVRGNHYQTPRELSKEGLKKPITYFDLIAAIPWRLLTSVPGLTILNILKITRVAGYMEEWRHKEFHQWSKMRLVFFAYWLGLAAHWIACGWIMVGGAIAKPEPIKTYISALYWTVTTMATVGYGDITPKNEIQMLFAMVVMICGAGVYGYIIGNIATIIAKRDPAKASYLEQMERITAFMNYRGVPDALQKRVRSYFTYLWQQRLGYDENTILSTLPLGLRRELALSLVGEIIEKVPLFREASESFIREVAMHLRPMVCTPGDFIFRAGDVARDMFFVARGRLEVIAQDGTTVIATVEEGSFVGEMALLLERPRSASVRALTFCDLYVLEKNVFFHIVVNYPEVADKIKEIMQQRQEG